jgi:hypothetical protein
MNAINSLPLSPKEASRYLRNTFNISYTPGTLARLRCEGAGPVFKKIGASVFYDIAELNKWVHWRTFIRRSTSDIYPAKYPDPGRDCDIWASLGITFPEGTATGEIDLH